MSSSTLLIVLCWIVYTCSYIGKVNYSANISQIELAYGVLHGEAGLVSTFFFFAYGAGQIFNGLFCKRYNVKYVVFGGLIVSATANLLLALNIPFSFLKYVWLLNGAALSVLWPSLIRLLSETLNEKEVPRAVVAMGTTVATGTFLVYGLSTIFVAIDFFRLIFFVAAAILPSVAILWLCSFSRLVKPVESKGGIRSEKTDTEGAGVRRRPNALLIASLCILAMFAVIDNLVKDGLTTWTPNILKATYDLPDSTSIFLTLFLPVLAVFGTAVATLLHKKIRNFVALCATLFFASSLALGAVIVCLDSNAFVVTVVGFSLVACLMSGVNNVITSMVPLYMKKEVPSGALAGVLNGFCYLGSMLSNYGLGSVADGFGWAAVFWLLLGCSVGAAALGYGYAFFESLFKRGKKKE